jgi:2-keto-3-deoxy-L-rhamnonate aldolase RhmA
LIYRTLDCGAQGIIVPHVNNAAEARNVVEGGKFPPVGKRGAYTSRQGHGVSDYMLKADDYSLLVILIEDIIAYENLDEILEVDNIDVFFVAPSDFAGSMGHTGNSDHPEVVETMNDAFRRIEAAGRNSGATCGQAEIPRYLDLGAKFLLTSIGPWLSNGAASFMDDVNNHSR